MSIFTNYLEKLGTNFLVASMVPSLALIVASLLAFDPTLVHKFNQPVDPYSLIGLGLVVFLLTVITGFTLTALNTYILKVFEGYVIFPPLRFLYDKGRRIHRENAHLQRIKMAGIAREIQKLEDHLGAHAELGSKLEQLNDEYYKAAYDDDQMYPNDLNDILPTQFGNTLKAAENHAGERYGFDGVMFWPRLVHVIPAEYRLTIDSTRNELSFLVNMSLVSLIFSFLSILAMFYTLRTVPVVSGDLATFAAFVLHVFTYLLAAALGLLSCGFFYNASIFSLSSFALTIRSSFDLFRLDLLKKLELVRPRDSDREFETWYNLNELIVLGSYSLTFKPLHYRKEKRSGDS